MSNDLIYESSPYLLQHAENPVAWYPWGPIALALAKKEDKPILLSIGYAACHWCHVMAHESFEDVDTAELMNRYFINIKVDREERPDLDAIYMSAVQAMTQQGGWPMTVMLTPDGEPFYGGTYYPPTPRYGMPSFRQVLLGVADAWEKRRGDVVQNARQLAAHIQRDVDLAAQSYVLDPLLLDRAMGQYRSSFDRTAGGFGGAPKFPPSMTLEFLLAYASKQGDDEAWEMAVKTLDKMAQGGIYDHIGGGFARYATDSVWFVPHFEKMLYDNAQLARVYLHAYQISGHLHYRRVCEETLDWVLREMSDQSGGFYSSLDADSEGVEGKFYVWQKGEIEAIVGKDSAELITRYYGVKADGNWEECNILSIPHPLELVSAELGFSMEEAERMIAVAKTRLYAERVKRVWPGLDDKVLTAWNGLMLAAFAEAGRVLNRPDYIVAAQKNGQFLWDNLRVAENGRLLRTWKAGHGAKYNGYLEDYAYLAEGLLALYQTTFETRWFVWAQSLVETMFDQFKDEVDGGFFDVSADHESLIVRPKTIQDSATPSANGLAARVLILLGLYTGERCYLDEAEVMISALYPAMSQYPMGFGQWLNGAWLLLSEPQELAIVGEVRSAESMLAVVGEQFRPNLIIAVGSDPQVPLLKDRPMIAGKPTAYLCQQFICQQPTTELDQLREQLG